NSVLAEEYGIFGLFAFPILGVAALIAAVVAGYTSRYRSYIFLIALVVAYCFADWWRIYMLNTGIIQFLILAVALWGVLGPNADRWTGGRWSRLTWSLVPADPPAKEAASPSEN